MSDFSFLKTGFGVVEENDDTTVLFVIAALRVFAKDGMITAARYATGQDREEITGQDMRKGLMYQARKFFEQPDDVLHERVREEVQRMEEEEEEDEGEEGEEEEGEEEEGEEEEGDEEEGDEEEGEGEEGDEEEGDEEEDSMTLEQCRRLVVHVDTICSHWHLWNPEDPVHRLIKHAIDQTGSEVEETRCA